MAENRRLIDSIGIVSVLLFFVVAVTTADALLSRYRIDLTENRLYTLSPGTTRLLNSLEEPLQLTLYFSATASGNYQPLRLYAQRITDMLREFERLSDGKLSFRIIDPVAFSKAEDQAIHDGLQSITLSGPDPVYLGLSGRNSIDGLETIPFFDPSHERYLEYDIAKLVHQLNTRERPAIGVISSLPVFGGINPRSGRIDQPWVIMDEIQQLFDVYELDDAADVRQKGLDTLLLIHPQKLSDEELYEIEQFLFGGGTAMVFVDPFAETTGTSSAFSLLENAGVTFGSNQFVADEIYALTVGADDQQPIRHPGLLGIPVEGLNSGDVISRDLNSIYLGFAGSFTVANSSPLNLEPLVTSSRRSGLLPTSLLASNPGPDQIRRQLESDEQQHVLAARLQGNTNSSFPERAANNPNHRGQPESSLNIIVAGDTDLLTDRYWAQKQSLHGRTLLAAFSGNGDFVLNALEDLSGNNMLIGMRSDAGFSRPFTKVEQLQRNAEDNFRHALDELEQQLVLTEDKLTELQTNAAGDSPQVSLREEIERFREERMRIRQELRQVQRDLNRDIEILGNRLRLINILLVPAIIICISTIAAWYRRRELTKGLNS